MQKEQEKGNIIVVYGGSGSGKSQVAENISEKFYQEGKKEHLYYIATMMPFGEESQKKIERHKRQRQEKQFVVKEIYYDLEQKQKEFKHSVLLLDCLSNLVANEWYRFVSSVRNGAEGENENKKREISQKIVETLRKIKEQNCDIIVVTNDIFRSVRTYWDGEEDYLSCLGLVNEQLIEQADCVYQIVAGQELCLKKQSKINGNILEDIDSSSDNRALLLPVNKNSLLIKEEDHNDSDNQENKGEQDKISILNEMIAIQSRNKKQEKSDLEAMINRKEQKEKFIKQKKIEMSKEIKRTQEKILVVGGEFQGKKEWVKRNWLISNEINIGDRVQNWNISNQREDDKYNLYFYVDQWILLKIEENSNFLSDNIVIEQKLNLLWELFENEIKIEGSAIFLMNEVGCGIVPLEKKDRIYRELSGRFMCQLAEKMDQAYQIVAGYEIRLK